MTFLAAQSLARQGFHVFPVRKGGKKPVHDGWQSEATCDPEQVAALWGNRPFNIGIFASRYRAGALLIVDVDVKNGKNGFRTILGHEVAGRDFPLTLELATPTGGKHLVYTVDEAVRQGVDVLGSGLDIRSQGGYIVGPGSVVDAGQYFTDRPASPVPAPAWLIEACGKPREKASDRTPLKGVDPVRAMKRALEYLVTAPEAVEGDGGDITTYRVAAKLLALGLTQTEAVDVMLSEHWHEGCGWTPAELQEKVANAERYMQEPRGADAPEAQFTPVEDAPAALHPFDRLNREYAFVIAGGGHHVLWETRDEMGHPVVEHLKEDTFHKKFASAMFPAGDKPMPLTQAWMKSDRRRSYDKLVFAPEQPVDARFYNTWRGFTVLPVAPELASARAVAAVAAWQEHVQVNLCNGHVGHARWLTAFFAHMVQKPWVKPLVALVFRGKKGTGKNAAVDRVGQLFSSNYFTADDDRYLTGNFNSHLESCLTLVLDEAQWAGAKKAEGRLKGLITGEYHLIERKGAEPYKVRNLTRVVILGNEDWLVPASQEERRFAVFNVGDGRKQDRAFFKEMREGMEADDGAGYGLLLHTLQHVDISGIDVNAAPRTKGLADQKRESLSPTHQWWLDCLIESQILGSEFTECWPETMQVNRFMDAARAYLHARGIRNWAPSNRKFNDQMEAVVDRWTAKKSATTKLQPGDKTYHYPLPKLADARAQMDAFLGDDTPWLD